jgi:hypothetical protein
MAGFLAAGLLAFAQDKAIAPDLSQVAAGSGWKVVGRKAGVFEADGRKAGVFEADGRKGIHLDEGPGDGLASLEGFEFADGVIEIDLKGRNVPQASFLGVAFRVADEKTNEAIYFRPFNFKHPNELNRSHGVQYISQPVNTWQKLRTEHPAVYEKPVNPVPEPDGWFHARIVVAGSRVQVFVNDASEPCLRAETLNERRSGRIGLWVGNGSDGTFANLKITPSR